MIVRQIRKTDLDGLHKLAKKAGTGITTLQDDKKLLRKRLEHTLYSFEKTVDSPSGESYLFVMEDENNKLVGICGILSKVGGFEPFYTYVMTTETHNSKDLNVRSNVEILKLEKKYSGPTEIGSLYAHPNARGNGKLLSFSRFLYIAEYLDRFEDEVIAELRGVVTTRGHSPFYEYCMKHFFKIDYMTADYLSMKNKQFIEDLMPKHPIYVDLLPKNVRDVFGKVHKNTEPAKGMLEKQNFSFNGEIDIFEAGPTYSCPTKEIHAVQNALGCTFGGSYMEDPQPAIIATYEPFRCCVGEADMCMDSVACVDVDTIAKLGLTMKDDVRVYFL